MTRFNDYYKCAESEHTQIVKQHIALRLPTVSLSLCCMLLINETNKKEEDSRLGLIEFENLYDEVIISKRKPEML